MKTAISQPASAHCAKGAGANSGSDSGPGFKPDFRHVRDWIFDLDNTLYRADNGIFARIDARMTEFIAQFLKLAPQAARKVQKDLYREHGTTLNGLIKVHGIDPEPYLDFVHDIVLDDLAADPGLRAAVARLQGRRYVFTNGCRRHAARILARLQMTDLFDEVWDIRTIGFIPKPDPAAYNAVLAHAAIAPHSAAMFDDIARNLVAPHALGMTTIWLNTPSPWSREGPEITPREGPEIVAPGAQIPVARNAHIDHETENLTQFLNRIEI